MLPEVLFAIFIIVVYGIPILPLILLRRNTKVAQYRKDVVHRIYEHSIGDIEEARENVVTGKRSLESYSSNVIDYMSSWRWKEYDTVKYKNMVYKFWKPLPSFYVNTELEQDIYDPTYTLKTPQERQHKLMATLSNKRKKAETKQV